MKKTMQFLFAMSIILEGNSSFAGTNKTSLVEDKPTLNPPLVNPIRGVEVAIITVLDDEFEPVSGAVVSAPCTGEKPITTNWSGTAIFPLRSNCHCNGSTATVTTGKGVEYIEIRTNTDNVVFIGK